MKRSSIIFTWVLSFITMVLFSEETNVIFYLSFVVFLFMSLCVKTCNKEPEDEKPVNDKYHE